MSLPPDILRPDPSEPQGIKFYFDKCLLSSTVEDPETRTVTAAMEALAVILRNDGLFSSTGCVRKITKPVVDRKLGYPEIWMIFRDPLGWRGTEGNRVYERWNELCKEIPRRVKIKGNVCNVSEFDDYKRLNPNMEWIDFNPNPELEGPKT